MLALKIILLVILALDQFFFWSSFERESRIYVNDRFMRLLLRGSLWANVVLVTFVCWIVFVLL